MKPIYAVLGTNGTYTVEAARCYWGNDIRLLGLKSIREVFEIVTRGSVAGGMVPAENTIAGQVAETAVGLREYPVAVAGEIWIPVQHCLLASESLELSDIELVVSQRQAFYQCRHFIQKYVPQARLVAVSNTEKAVQLAKMAGQKVAAIGSAMAAEAHGMRVLVRGIQDMEDNRTRFIHITARQSH